MPQEPFRHQTRIRFIDTDASGRIHYTAMFRYFESAEIEFLRTHGISYALYRAYTFPRVHVECDFKIALGHDDLIDIEIRLVHLGRSSIRFNFITYRDGIVTATGAVVVACVDTATQRAVPWPHDLRATLASSLSHPPEHVLNA
ncbi:MAG: acyl-CoA thioesterase [Acidobacteriaceae bacterium]|nr:acyl-CoA thioesterase [Acidobacteriaceae bacterium]